MSVELVTGVPGSGKSYFAAKKVKDIYDSKKRLVFTNINLKVEYDEYLKPLDVAELFVFAKKEYELFEKFTKLSEEYKKRHDSITLLDDDVSIEEDSFSEYFGNYDKYLKESGLLEEYGGSFIAWDECQNDLVLDDATHEVEHKNKSALKIWVRFFSYHRHFDMDILLITQDVSLVHRRIKSFISRYYFGQNPAKRFTSTTLKFKVYTDSREFQKYYIETINLKMQKEIHDFYDSGEYKPAKSLLLAKLFMPFFLIFGVFVAYNLFFSSSTKQDTSFSADTSLPHQQQINDLNNTDQDINEDGVFEDTNHLMQFYCSLETCSMRNSSFVIPLSSMKTFCDSVGIEILFSSKLDNYYSLVVVKAPESIYNDLMRFEIQKKGDKHEKGKMDFTHNSVPKF